MNRNRHRVVFNAARGLRMVVAECARSIGSGATGATGATAIALVAALLATPAASQIVADPSAPGSQRPTILGTGNGVPLINITTPSAAGVSRNTYRQFDVGSPGAILNNSRTGAPSQLGGAVPANPWLATGPARVMGGAERYFSDVGEAQRMLDADTGRVILDSQGKVVLGSDGKPQTTFSATQAQRDDPYGNVFPGGSPDNQVSVTPGKERRDAQRLQWMNTPNGQAVPDTTLEETLLGVRLPARGARAVVQTSERAGGTAVPGTAKAVEDALLRSGGAFDDDQASRGGGDGGAAVAARGGHRNRFCQQSQCGCSGRRHSIQTALCSQHPARERSNRAA